MDADFKPDEPHSLDLASCIGAAGSSGACEYTRSAEQYGEAGGWVIVESPYWRQEPSGDYLEALGVRARGLRSHSSNAEAGERRGMELVHTIVSSKDDFDRYEGLQWFATDEYARTHPDDPDLTEVA